MCTLDGKDFNWWIVLMFTSDKITVVVPVYNVEQYIEHTIKSILNQSYTNIELILVNDGSNDNSQSIDSNRK